MARVAVIEVGSRAVRLLIADASSSGVRAISNTSEPHKLLAISGGTDPAAILTHLGDTIRDYGQRGQRAGADVIAAFGSEVLRALDPAIKSRLEEIAGMPVVALDAYTEARAAFAAGVIGLEQEVEATDGQFNVIDQGGSNVEVAWGQRAPGVLEMSGHQGFSLGTTALKTMVQSRGIAVTLREVRQAVEHSAIRPRPGIPTIVMSSAITKVAWVDVRPGDTAKFNPREIHGVRVSLRRIAELVKLSSADLPAFQALIEPNHPKGGEPEIVAAGLAGLAPIIKQIGVSEVIASGWGTRYGYAWLRGNEEVPA
jgi:exopolyphosphatase/pppGpp-phosphohydrolase